MPIITNLEDKILQLVRSNQYQWFTVGINLGGVPGEGGGSGTPVGGFTGQLVQSRVTYDTTEAESLTVPSSGQSLVHNLNRIRYWLNQRGLPLVIQDEGVEVASGVTTLDFVGAPVDVTISGGKAIVTISGTGEGGGGDTVKVSSDDTVTNYLDSKITVALPITKVVNNPGGNENIEVGFNGDLDDLSDVSIVTAVSGQVLAYTNEWLNLSLAAAGISAVGHTHVENDITNLDHDAVKLQGDDISAVAPASGQALVYNSIEYAPGTVGADIDVEEDDAPKVSSATVLNFEGAVDVVDDGGGKATVVVSSGTALDSFEAKVSSDDTTENFLENKIVAGTNVTIAVQDEGANETLEISASGGGSALEVKDEGSTLTSTGTSLDFTGTAVTATTVGDDVTVDIPGMVVNVPGFIGTKYFLASQIQTNTGGYWTPLDWDAVGGDGVVIYNEPGAFEFCPNGKDIRVPETGYYNVSVSVTISGASVPPLADRNMSLNLFDEAVTVAAHSDLRASGIQTFHVNTTIFVGDISDIVSVQFFNGGHDSTEYPYVISGAYTQMTLHKVQASVISIEGVRVTQINSGSVTISDDTVTDLDFEGEQYDLNDFWDTGDRATFTIPSSGYYNVQGLMTWDKWGGGTDRRFLIERNGSDILAQAQDVHPGPNDTKELSQTLSTDAYFDEGDTVKFRVWHNRGENLNIISGAAEGAATNATISKIGET